jgi:hypothetical protein
MRWDCASTWRQLGRLAVLPLLLLADLARQLGATVRQALRPAGGRRRGDRARPVGLRHELPAVRWARRVERPGPADPQRRARPGQT